MKIVITGGSGSVAQGLIALTLAKTEHFLVLVDRKPPSATAVIDSPRIEYVTAELRSYTTFLEILTSKRADALIHLAAYSNPWLAHPSETNECNTILSYNALVAAAEAGIKRVVMASSVNAIGGVYCKGEPQYEYFPIDEQHPMRPEDVYSLSKQILELQAAQIARSSPDMSIVSLRFHHCTPAKKTLNDPNDPYKPRKDLWGWVSIESSARACLLALDVPWRGHDFVQIVADEHFAEPYHAEELAKKYFPDAKRKSGPLTKDQSFYDCSKAERLLGWKHVGGKQL